MFRKAAILMGFILLLGAAGCIYWSSKPAEAKAAQTTDADYRALQSVPTYLDQVQRHWKGNGNVIVGRLECPTGIQIASRTPISEDGSFCTPLYVGRKLMFYAHGFEPLEAAEGAATARLADVGTQAFQPAKPENLRRVRARVAADNWHEPLLQVQCTLAIFNRDSLWREDAHDTSAPSRVIVATHNVAPGEMVEFEGLSRIPYVVTFTAPGYVSHEYRIDPEASYRLDLGDIEMKPARMLEITYRTRVRPRGSNWSDTGTISRAVVSSHVPSKLTLADRRSPRSTPLELRFRPGTEGVKASVDTIRPAFFELGEQKLDDIARWEDVLVPQSRAASDVVLREGQLYLLRADNVDAMDVELLMYVAN